MGTDILGALKAEVGDSGHVSVAYGGFEIVVVEPDRFPWERVFRLLLALQQDVWVRSREERLVIMSKPPAV